MITQEDIMNLIGDIEFEYSYKAIELEKNKNGFRPSFGGEYDNSIIKAREAIHERLSQLLEETRSRNNGKAT